MSNVDLQSQIELVRRSAVFPLVLSPFEKFIVWDETKTQPMNSFIELQFDTRLDTEIFESSLAFAVHRNPLLASRLVSRNKNMYWEYDPEHRPRLVDESQTAPLDRGHLIPIDLEAEPGVRFWYGEKGDGSRVLIQLHHACSDGLGLRRMLIDALCGYAKATQHVDPAHDEVKERDRINLDLLEKRFDFQSTFTGPPTKTLTVWQRIKNAHYFHFQTPTPLAARPKSSDERRDLLSDDPKEPLRHAILTRDQSLEVSNKAKASGLAVNDVALALLFRACALWNDQRGVSDPKTRYRILMPYDLRSRIDLRMPAANRLSFSFLGRTRKQCDNVEELIRGVHEEIQWIKETRLPMDFLNALEGSVKHPWFVKWVLGLSPNMSTTVLTYTGDIMRGVKKYFPEEDNCRRVGDALLRNIMIAPPIRRNTNISLGLCTNWGQLCFSAAWNRETTSSQECESFLALYQETLLRWCGQENQRISSRPLVMPVSH